MAHTAAPLVWFATDFGLDDPFVGVCHAVMARLAPAVRVVDLAHGIAPGDVRQGAVLLHDVLPWLQGGVVLAVVDPGVGTRRRALILEAGVPPMLLVGPDNGLLMPAAARNGGVSRAWQVRVPVRGVRAPTGTFDGRDVFAPAAALLAAGGDPSVLGAPVAVDGLTDLHLPEAAVADGEIRTEVLQVDRFGNLQLAADPDDLAAARLAVGSMVSIATGQAAVDGRVGRTFADVAAGEVAVLADSWGRLQVAVNQGSAARRLAVAAGAVLTVAAADSP